MSRKARKRAAAASVVALIAGGALAFGQLTGTLAVFNAETDNPGAAFNGSWIPAPTVSSSTVGGSGNGQAVLTWVSGNSTAMPGGATNPVTGQELLYADGGSGSSASCGSYSSFKAETAALTTDTVTGSNFTDWWCFEIQSTSTGTGTSGSWTSGTPAFTPVRLLVPTGIAVTSGNTNGQPDSPDVITISFNEGVSLSGSPTGVCIDANNNAIALGYSGSCAAGVQGSVGQLTGFSFVKKTIGETATISASGSQVTVSITGSGGKSITGNATFTAGSALIATNGGAQACSTGACQLPFTNGF